MFVWLNCAKITVGIKKKELSQIGKQQNFVSYLFFSGKLTKNNVGIGWK